MKALTVADVIVLYARHSQITKLHGPEAYAQRQTTFREFAERYGPIPVDQLKPYHLTDFVESHPRWSSPSTRRQKAAQIKAAFQWAYDQGRIDRHPFHTIRYPDGHRRPDMPDATLDKICAVANKHYERVCRFLRLTGCRLSEMCRAKWPDVDLERGVWLVLRHKTFKYTGKARLVALVVEAVDLLKVLKAEAQVMGTADGHVFHNTQGRPWNRNTLGHYLRLLKGRHQLGEQATLHGVRHRSASAAIAAGAPIKLVAEQLGHSSVTTTEKYYCDLSGAVDQIRDAFARGVPR